MTALESISTDHRIKGESLMVLVVIIKQFLLALDILGVGCLLCCLSGNHHPAISHYLAKPFRTWICPFKAYMCNCFKSKRKAVNHKFSSVPWHMF